MQVALTKITHGMLAREALADAHKLVMKRMGTNPWRKINRLDLAMMKRPQADMPLHHVFTDGLYQRSVFLPAGTLLTSRVHLTEHPFLISTGIISVWTDDDGWVTFEGFHSGITKPATRRVLYAHTPTLWTTTHLNPDNERDPDKIIERITFNHRQLLLGGIK